MRILLFLALFYAAAFGYNYNDLLIKVQSEIFPKVLLLDKKLDEKLVNGKVVYAVLYDKLDTKIAQTVHDEVKRKHDSRLGDYDFEIQLVRFDEITDDFDATAVYALNMGENTKKVVDMAISRGMMTFSYDINNLDDGMLLSMMIEKFTVLYVNKNHLKHYPVDFVDSLYQIAVFEW